jgi:tail tube protein
MTLASGTRVQLAYITEVTHGVTPGTPAGQILRATQRNINMTKTMLKSAEVRADRQVADVRHGMVKTEGTLGFELSRQSYDDFITYLTGGTWEAITLTTAAGDIAVTGVSTFTRPSGSFVTDGLKPGMVIKTTGFSASNNNGHFVVKTVAATTITVFNEVNLTTVAAAGAQAMTVPGKVIGIGTTLTTFTMERAFLDVSEFQVFTGCTVNQMSLKVAPEAIVGGTFTVLGMTGSDMAGSTVFDSAAAAPTSSPFSSFDGVMGEGSSVNSVMTGMDLTINNNRTLGAVIGSNTSPDVFDGTVEVSGTMSVYFADSAEYTKFFNETETVLAVLLDDLNGTDFMCIYLPRVKYTGASTDPPQNGPIVMAVPFQALAPTAGGTCIQIQRSNT